MPLHFDWTSDLDLVAQTRLRCYARAQKELKAYQQEIRDDGRAKSGDFLIASRDGEAVGTTTSQSMTMWVRGAALPCQGIAWVGTVRSARRSDGIASQLMHETLRKAREREQIVSALMPFRVSYYEHFGFGMVEKRIEWTVPTAIFPHGKTDGVRHFESDDAPAVAACRQRQTQAGQCDIETSAAAWINRRRDGQDGFEIVDRTSGGWMHIADQVIDGKRIIRVIDNAWDSIDALKRQLYFLGNLRDQYRAAIIQLPTDLPLNELLRERQIPHRIVDHLACSATIQTRMMVRVMDHAKFFEKLKLPAGTRGSVVVAVKETEGNLSKFKLEIEGGRSRAMPSETTAEVECRDVEWASIACGAIAASTAARLGLIQVTRPQSIDVLDALSVGPSPFCGEYF